MKNRQHDSDINTLYHTSTGKSCVATFTRNTSLCRTNHCMLSYRTIENTIIRLCFTTNSSQHLYALHCIPKRVVHCYCIAEALLAVIACSLQCTVNLCMSS